MSRKPCQINVSSTFKNMSRVFIAFFPHPTASHVLNEKSLCDWFSVFNIKLCIHDTFVSNCLNNVFNYIWFLNIIVFIMCFFQDSHVLFPLKKRALVIFCSMRPLVASGEKPKAPPSNRNNAY